jgi:hypothetical protein
LKCGIIYKRTGARAPSLFTQWAGVLIVSVLAFLAAKGDQRREDHQHRQPERRIIMALIKCPECGTEVSELADKCPKCACPVAKVRDGLKLVETVKKIKPSTLIFRIVACTILAIAAGKFAFDAWLAMKERWLIFDGMFFGLFIAIFVSAAYVGVINTWALLVKRKWQKGNDKT